MLGTWDWMKFKTLPQFIEQIEEVYYMQSRAFPQLRRETREKSIGSSHPDPNLRFLTCVYTQKHPTNPDRFIAVFWGFAPTAESR